jgi:hypothetical protein
MIRKGMVFLALLAIGAAPKAAPIAMKSIGWGLTIHDWQIAPDGTITATFRDPATTVPLPAKMITRRSAPDPARYRRIAALVRPVLDMSGQNVPCTLGITDQNTYAIRQGDRPAVEIYDGCREPAAQAIAATIVKADMQITAWIGNAPILDERPSRP